MKKLLHLFLLTAMILSAFPTVKAETLTKVPLETLVPKDTHFVMQISTEDLPQTKAIFELIDIIKLKGGTEVSKEDLANFEKLMNILTTPNKYLLSGKIEKTYEESAFNLFFYNNADQLQTILDTLKNAEIEVKESRYNTKQVYNFKIEDKNIYLTEINAVVVLSTNEKGLQNIIDLKPENSIQNVENYKKTLQNLDENYLGLLYADFQAIISKTEEQADLAELTVTLPYQTVGLSLRVEKTGLQIKSHVIGDQKGMDEQGITFDTVNFTPNLFKQFPKGSPFTYSETANLKANIELLLKKMEDMRQKAVEAEIAQNKQLKETGGATHTDDFVSRETTKEKFTKSTGLDLDKDVLSWLDKELGFAVQDVNDLFPAISLIANASSNPESAKKCVTAITTNVNQLLISVSAINEGKTYTTITEKKIGNSIMEIITIDFPTMIKDAEAPSEKPKMGTLSVMMNKKKQSGKEEALNILKSMIKPLTITYGVTDDNLFVFSTYPSIEKHLSEGLQNNADFKSLYEQTKIGNGSLGYISISNMVNYVYRISNKFTEVQTDIDLESWYQFINIMEIVNQVKDIISTQTTQKYEASELTFIRTNTSNESPFSFKKFQEGITEIKSKDSDGDGRSDYEELYIYNTDPNKKDDLAQTNYSDIDNQGWYAPYVHALSNKEISQGYVGKDGQKEFKPDQPITRAEFTKMVVETFNVGGTSYYKKNPNLKDVNYGDWYYPYVTKAYNAGLIKGYEDGTFKPNNPITRAEALKIAIIAHTSDFATEGETTTSEFSDTDKHWAKNYINFAFKNNVVKGVSETKFAPEQSITRAEAAKIIIEIKKLDFAKIESQSLKDSLENEAVSVVADALFKK